MHTSLIKVINGLKPAETNVSAFIYEVSCQIEKDLSLSGLSFSPEDDALQNNYWDKLTDFVRAEMESNPEKIRAMLYRVDVSEKKVAEIFLLQGEKSLLLLMNAVVLREIQKVLSRRNSVSGKRI